MKKQVLKSLAIVALATTASVANVRNHGPYIGFGAGTVVGEYTKVELSDNVTPINYKFAMTKFNAALDLILGYAIKVNSWHLGLEADYLFGNINDSASFPTANANNALAKVTSNGAWGLGLRVGYHCERVMGFIRLGMENRRFKSTASAFGPVGLPADTARNTLSFSTNKTAFAPGVGVQTNLTKNITGTLEYRVALYGKVSRTLANPDANNVTTVFRFKPRVSTVLASFRYHF